MTGVSERAAAVVPVRPSNRVRAAIEAASAAAALAVADVLVRMVPFGRIARRVEGPIRRGASDHPTALAAPRVAWAVAAAQRRLPWNVPCLATALAANRLLAWRGVASEVWLGVRASPAVNVDAHAWLVADGHVVTGRSGSSAYEPLYALVTSPARPA
jgi:transglutaminase superfamily protein